MVGLKRLTFWKRRIREEADLERLSSSDLLGYAILKKDRCAAIMDKDCSRWHVFESVFASPSDGHLFIPCKKRFSLTVGCSDPRPFEVTGPMYCEQNRLNKACAQVALRSLVSSYLQREPSFSEIHELALAKTGRSFDPAGGLGISQIRAVLQGLKVKYTDITYERRSLASRKGLPFQKFVYSAIESGAGALLGFKFKKGGPEKYHLIPLVGHTFNKHQWVSHSDSAYFDLGNPRYISSEAWVGSFVGHDDSFGANLTIPRFYLRPENVEYVAELVPKGIMHDGPTAEVIASHYLYSVLGFLDLTKSRWLNRLNEYADRKEVVLRALPMTKQEYVTHLAGLKDWKRRKENIHIVDFVDRYIPKYTWMVEISAPGLFPINQRKLGEIVIDASYAGSLPKGGAKTSAGRNLVDYRNFVFARFPAQFLFISDIEKNKPVFVSVPSFIKSHTPVYTD
jgi:hypothetical protein